MGEIRIYADNGCDLDRELLEELGVRLFYMSVIIGGRSYKDRLTIDPPEFYRLISKPGVVPTTAQVTLGEFQKEFERVVRESNDEIIYIAFSSKLSGTYQAACLARDAVDPHRITVIDSKGASVGYGLTVIKAARAVAAGKGKEEVIAGVQDNINRMQHIFIVGSFDMLKRGGRVKATSAIVGNLLNIKLILHFVDGEIVPLEKVHGFKKARKRMLDIMRERGIDLQNQTIGISYSKDFQGALELKEMIKENFGCQDFIISEIGAVIGSHVGAGTYSVFFLGK